MKTIDTMEEVWKDIPGYEWLYQVSNYGRVKSLERYTVRGNRPMYVPEKILKRCLAANGYYVVNLNNHGYKTHYVHRLVATAFIINPANLPCVEHINAEKLDDAVDNLRWCTYDENNNNPITRRRMSEGSKGIKWHPRQFELARERQSKAVRQISKTGELIKVWESPKVASKELGICIQTIYRCCNHPERSKTAGGYAWGYV